VGIAWSNNPQASDSGRNYSFQMPNSSSIGEGSSFRPFWILAPPFGLVSGASIPQKVLKLDPSCVKKGPIFWFFLQGVTSEIGKAQLTRWWGPSRFQKTWISEVHLASLAR